MADSKNPFAKRNGRIITINDLNENGLRCNCKCPVCYGTFVARMELVLIWYEKFCEL